MFGYFVATRTARPARGSSLPAVSRRFGDRDAARADAEVERRVDFRIVELHQHVGAADAELRRAEGDEGGDVERAHAHHVERRVVGGEAQPAAVLVGVVGRRRATPARASSWPHSARMRPLGSARINGAVTSGSSAVAG